MARGCLGSAANLITRVRRGFPGRDEAEPRGIREGNICKTVEWEFMWRARASERLCTGKWGGGTYSKVLARPLIVRRDEARASQLENSLRINKKRIPKEDLYVSDGLG